MRESRVPAEIMGFIRSLREEHPRFGKEKIKVFLGRYCQEKGLQTGSSSTVRNIIERHNFFFQRSGRIYHEPDSYWARRGQKSKNHLRVKHRPNARELAISSPIRWVGSPIGLWTTS